MPLWCPVPYPNPQLPILIPNPNPNPDLFSLPYASSQTAAALSEF